MPQISVIVPVYNVEQYLSRCVDSILVQTFADFELILIDDGSPDNCPAICDAYASQDERVVVIHKKNGGVSSARNVGLDVAKGDYIAFCDSDDYWKSDFLEVLYREAITIGADEVVCNLEAVDEKYDFVFQTKHIIDQRGIELPEERWEYLRDICLVKYGWEIWTRLFKNNIIQCHNIRFCTTCQNYAEDWAFTMQYGLYANTVRSIEYVGYCYVLRSGSMMDRSKEILKLPQVNEALLFLSSFYNAVFADTQYCKMFPVIFFLMMHTEYKKVIGKETYIQLGKEIKKIYNQTWFRKQTKGIINCKKYWEQQYSKRISQQIELFSRYCLHKNWKRFCFESNIAYRFFIKGE